MSQTIIEKLLKGAEVEWKPIDEIFTLKNGYTPSKSVKEYWIGGTVPWFRMEDLRAGERILKDSAQKVHINGVKGKLFPKDSIIMSTSATVGEHALILTDFLCNQRFTNFSVSEKYKALLDIKYVYYYFFVIDKKAQENTSISSFPSVQMDKLKKWMFPIPPLSVQKEIVRILDAFTSHAAELTAELTAELNQRKKQYNYYLNKLLTFSDDEVEWKKLGDITQTTKNIKWKNNNQHYLYIDLTSVDRENNVVARTVEISATNAPSRAQKIVEKDDVIFATTRPTLQRYTIIDDKYSGQIASSGYCVLRAKYKNVLPKWIYYNIASNKFLTYVEANQSGSAYPSISDVKVKEFILPIPSIETQKRIVSILDKFDTLTTSISEGLPREIELRNKQYEYYRNQLLNFPKQGNDAIKQSPTNL